MKSLLCHDQAVHWCTLPYRNDDAIYNEYMKHFADMKVSDFDHGSHTQLSVNVSRVQ